MREKLTYKFAKTVKPTAGKVARYFDTSPSAPSGFLLRVTAGARVWALRYRVRDSGREREITIGDVENRRLVDAYKRARELRREIEDGGDPLGDREERRAAPTVDELAKRFIEESLPSRAPRTRAEYQAMIRDWVLPAIGQRKVADVKRDDVERLHRRITGTGRERRANAVKSLCSTIFTKAIAWGIITDNPAAGIEKNTEHSRERYLSAEELDRLLTELEQRRERRPDSVDAIHLLVLTGARRAEVLTMLWRDIDLAAAVWTKPSRSTKTGKRSGQPHWVPLSPEAVAVLQRRQKERDTGGKVVHLRGDLPVFRGYGSKSHTNRLERDWRAIRAAAGLNDLRLHDLRHSFASFLVSAGEGLPVVGKLLGHTTPQMTQRYAHAHDLAQRRAVDAIGRMTRRAK